MMVQAGPGNDIHAGSPGSHKAPTQNPASLVFHLGEHRRFQDYIRGS